ncbi:MAG: hypothetical protein V4812_02360 [Pseudomonadota bacterium]
MDYRRALLLGLVLLAASALAAPAPWYQWRSQANGVLLCAQVNPGPGWTRFAGPFDNAGCQDRPRRGLL